MPVQFEQYTFLPIDDFIIRSVGKRIFPAAGEPGDGDLLRLNKKQKLLIQVPTAFLEKNVVNISRLHYKRRSLAGLLRLLLPFYLSVPLTQ